MKKKFERSNRKATNQQVIILHFNKLFFLNKVTFLRKEIVYFWKKLTHFPKNIIISNTNMNLSVLLNFYQKDLLRFWLLEII